MAKGTKKITTVGESGAAEAAPETPYRREKRGITTKVQCDGAKIAKEADIIPADGGLWAVQGCNVNFPRKSGTCKAYRKSVPKAPCAHWWAVAYYLDPPEHDEFLEPIAAPKPPARVRSYDTPAPGGVSRTEIVGGYSRYANLYNDHLTTEFRDVMFFVQKLFPAIMPELDTRVQKLHGPKNTPLADLMFAAFLHAHLNWSFRRTEGFLAFLAHPEIGFITDYPGFNLVNQFVRSEEATPILRDVLALIAEPFRDCGPMTLAADGTGTSSNRFDDWRVEGKYGVESRTTRRWFKAHAACDVDTLAIIALYVTHKDKSEKKVLIERIIPELVARDYDVERFLADGGYNATEIRDLIIEALGAVPGIPWGANSVRAVSYAWRNKVKHGHIIEQLHREFKNDGGALFKAEYCFRVKVENLFSSIKTKYSGSVRSLIGNGPENEILLKAICHNLSMLQAAAKIYGLNIGGSIEGVAAA